MYVCSSVPNYICMWLEKILFSVASIIIKKVGLIVYHHHHSTGIKLLCQTQNVSEAFTEFPEKYWELIQVPLKIMQLCR